MALTRVGFVGLPPHRDSGFDHGDVHLASRRIFVAHTAEGTVEVIDGDSLVHAGTIPGSPEASGVLCAQEEGLVFAAARGAGKVLVIDAGSLAVLSEFTTGPRPNGLAWNGRGGTLLVADVEDFRAGLLSAGSGELVGNVDLPGRPRWCVYDAAADRFLVNICDPACVAVVAGAEPSLVDRWAVSSAGPHGLDLDVTGGRALVATDGGAVSVLDLSTGREVTSVPIGGQPDAIWYNPLRRLLYVAIGKPGLVDVIDAVAMRRCEQVMTEEGAHTTAFDGPRQRLIVFLPRTCRAAIYEETL
jgi:DNA-binding beta-propeller fold protein YncE